MYVRTSGSSFAHPLSTWPGTLSGPTAFLERFPHISHGQTGHLTCGAGWSPRCHVILCFTLRVERVQCIWKGDFIITGRWRDPVAVIILMPCYMQVNTVQDGRPHPHCKVLVLLEFRQNWLEHCMIKTVCMDAKARSVCSCWIGY